MTEHIARKHSHNVLNQVWAEKIFNQERTKMGRPNKEGTRPRAGHKEKPTEIPNIIERKTPTSDLPQIWDIEICINDFPRMHVKTNCKIVLKPGKFKRKFAEVPNLKNEPEKFHELREKFVRERPVAQREQESSTSYDSSVEKSRTTMPHINGEDVEKSDFAQGGSIASLVVKNRTEPPLPRREEYDFPQISQWKILEIL